MNNIYYLGPDNSYSHFITKKLFSDPEDHLITCHSFDEIIHNTQQDSTGIGTLPIENSITSDVHENIDAIFKYNLQIIKEGYLAIVLCLVGLKDATVDGITDVYSHPKALQQSTDYIKKNNIQTHEVTSTSAGVEILLTKNNLHQAVIGSKNLAIDNRLKILKDNINNQQMNITRFVYVAGHKSTLQKDITNKASIIFHLSHTPGSLAELLSKLAGQNINLVKIQSRPIAGTAWEYEFLLDIEKNELSAKTLDELFAAYTNMYRILGIYKKGSVFEN